MAANIVAIVIGLFFNVFCLVIAGILLGGEDKKVGGGIGFILVGIFSLVLIFYPAFYIGTGNPAGMTDISDSPIYTIQTRLAYNDGVNGIVVIKDAEKQDSKIRIIGYKMKELPDANLVRVKDGKFVPFTLCQKTQ